MKINQKSKFNKIGVIVFSLFVVFIALPIKAQGLLDRLTNTATGTKGAGFTPITSEGDVYLAEKIASFIQILLSFLGVIFLILTIYGGFLWMTARGNEKQVEDAKKIIINSTVGVVIVMMAYAITWFVLFSVGGAADFNLES